MTVPTGTVWGTGTLTADSANTTDSAFVTTPGPDYLVVRDAGTYAVTIVGKWGIGGGTTGRNFSQITDSAATTIHARAAGSIGEDTISVSHPNLKLAANTQIKLTTLLTFGGGGNTTWQGRVRVTRIQ